MTDWRPVLDVPGLPPCGSWDRPHTTLNRISGREMMDEFLKFDKHIDELMRTLSK